MFVNQTRGYVKKIVLCDPHLRVCEWLYSFIIELYLSLNNLYQCALLIAGGRFSLSGQSIHVFAIPYGSHTVGRREIIVEINPIHHRGQALIAPLLKFYCGRIHFQEPRLFKFQYASLSIRQCLYSSSESLTNNARPFGSVVWSAKSA
jgi:hypothetical protein